MDMDSVQIKGVDSTVRVTQADLKEDASLVIHERIMTHGQQKAETDFAVDLNGAHSSANVVSRSVAKGDSQQKFISYIRGNNACSGHTECDAIIMDPPSYGRGPKGEIWKLEDNVYDFIKLTTQVLSDQPLFFLVNSYTTGLQPAVLHYMISTALKKFPGRIEADEVGLPVSDSGLVLPCGAAGRFLGE